MSPMTEKSARVVVCYALKTIFLLVNYQLFFGKGYVFSPARSILSQECCMPPERWVRQAPAMLDERVNYVLVCLCKLMQLGGTQ